MAHLTIENDTVTVTMQGLDNILAVRGQLSVPLAPIRGVDVRLPEACAFFHGCKSATNLPGVVTVDGNVSCDVHDPERTIGVDLEGETYQRLIIEVDVGATPEDVTAWIDGAIRQSRVSHRATGTAGRVYRIGAVLGPDTPH